MNLENKKFISIGGGCFSNILLKGLDKITGQSFRVQGPIDNLRSKKGIKGSLKLFDGSLREELIGPDAKYTIVPKPTPMKDYDEVDIHFDFEDFVIIHNDYRTDKCKMNLNKRFDNFEAFFRDAMNNPNYYFIYTLCQYDRMALGTIRNVKNLLEHLGLKDRVIVIGSSIAPIQLPDKTPSNDINWPDFNWPEWQETFKDRYIIIRNSNYYDEAIKLFLEALKNMEER